MSSKRPTTDPVLEQARKRAPASEAAGPRLTSSERWAGQCRWNSSREGVDRPAWVAPNRVDRASYLCAFPLDLMDNVLLPYVCGPPSESTQVGRLPRHLSTLSQATLTMDLSTVTPQRRMCIAFPLFASEPTAYTHCYDWKAAAYSFDRRSEVSLLAQHKSESVGIYLGPCQPEDFGTDASLMTSAILDAFATNDGETYAVYYRKKAQSPRSVMISEVTMPRLCCPSLGLTSWHGSSDFPPAAATRRLIIDERGFPAVWATCCGKLTVARIAGPGLMPAVHYALVWRTDTVCDVAFGPPGSNRLWVLMSRWSLSAVGRECRVSEIDTLTGDTLRGHEFTISTHYTDEMAAGLGCPLQLLVDSHNQALVCHLASNHVLLLNERGVLVTKLCVAVAAEVRLSPQGCLVVRSAFPSVLSWFF